ncbi:MAG: hypothetical protein FD145_722 [Candidatus Saganbacteria bacterium]|uniref:Flagellar FliJ protein n=1 Tax=Candidatus Saganbacteria bacterium TaxID=2575572 RepID=A0A833L184_UNCSA|nr:MAG: hypothetical protein FD145_722 [Candidatus Saganbacteria bacterium]
MARKSKKGQFRVINEIKDQLILQADRWGKSGFYTPLKLEEMELEQCRKIKSDFLAERSNLEYEMCLLGTDKKEVLIKIERLESYIKKADRVIEAHERRINKMLDKLVGDKKAVKKAEDYINTKHTVSVIIQ